MHKSLIQSWHSTRDKQKQFTVTELTDEAVCGVRCVAQNLLYRDGFCENTLSNCARNITTTIRYMDKAETEIPQTHVCCKQIAATMNNFYRAKQLC